MHVNRKSDDKHCVTLDDLIFLHGKSNGERERVLFNSNEKIQMTARYWAFKTTLNAQL